MNIQVYNPTNNQVLSTSLEPHKQLKHTNSTDVLEDLPIQVKSSIGQMESQIKVEGASIRSNSTLNSSLSPSQKEKMVETVIEFTQSEEDNDNLNVEVVVATASSTLLINPTETSNVLKQLPISKPPKTYTKKEIKKRRHKENVKNRVAKQAAKAELIDEIENQNQLFTEKLKITQEQGFELFLIDPDLQPARPVLQDKTGLAEDFRFLSSKKHNKRVIEQANMEIIGKKHLWKRLNFYHIMCCYIKEKAPYLEDMAFGLNEKNQFKVRSYVVPKTFIAKPPRKNDERTPVKTISRKGFERAHVSLLSKIVVKKAEELFEMKGPLVLTTQKIETNLHEFFNICDISPYIVNDIDWYVECHVRIQALSFLNDVKKGTRTIEEASDSLASIYQIRLIKLIKKINSYSWYKPDILFYQQNPSQFRQKMQRIQAHKEDSLVYIIGMLHAIAYFKSCLPDLISNSPSSYSLYKKIA